MFSPKTPYRKKWITKFAGGGPDWAAGCDRTIPPKELKRDVLMDVYEVGYRCFRLSHTAPQAQGTRP